MFKNKSSLTFIVLMLLLASFFIPSSSPAKAANNTISFTISSTVNDCLPDANNVVPIEAIFVDSQGQPLVDASWYAGACTISPVVVDQLLDFETTDLNISISGGLVFSEGINLSLDHINLQIVSTGQFINRGTISMVGAYIYQSSSYDPHYTYHDPYYYSIESHFINEGYMEFRYNPLVESGYDVIDFSANGAGFYNSGEMHFYSGFIVEGFFVNGGQIHIHSGRVDPGDNFYDYSDHVVNPDEGFFLHCDPHHALFSGTYYWYPEINSIELIHFITSTGVGEVYENCKPQAGISFSPDASPYPNRYYLTETQALNTYEAGYFDDGSAGIDDYTIDVTCPECVMPVKGTVDYWLIHEYSQINIIYTPNPDAIGDDQFTFRLCDYSNIEDNMFGEEQCSDPVTLNITILTDPVAEDDSASTMQGNELQIPVVENDHDIVSDKTDWYVTNLDTPQHAVNFNINDQVFTYQPDPTFIGTDTFQYEICNVVNYTAAACSDPATVTIEVIQNLAPIANPDTAYTVEYSWVDIPVLANDSDPEGLLDQGSLQVVTYPSHVFTQQYGSDDLIISSNGSIGYRPEPGFIGSDSFSYQICDIYGACSEASVQITVGQNHPPAGTDDSYITSYNTPITFDVFENDTDPDGNLDVSEIYLDNSDPDYPGTTQHGMLDQLGDGGGFTYTPDLDFVGTDEFYYFVYDQTGDRYHAHVEIRVTGPFVIDLTSWTQEEINSNCTLFDLAVNESMKAGLDCALELPSESNLSSSIGNARYANGRLTWEFPTTDGPAESQQVTVTVMNSDAKTVGTIYFDLEVFNLPPAIDSMQLSPSLLRSGEALNVTTNFSDPALDEDAVYICQVNFGDGSIVDGYVNGFICYADHIYTILGVYEIKVTITDKDGGTITGINHEFDNGLNIFVFDLTSLSDREISDLCTKFDLAVNEGEEAGLDCAFALPADSTLKSSLGAVQHVAGRLGWAFDATDGPAESQNVWVSVFASNGEMIGYIYFNLDVFNLSPTIDVLELTPSLLQLNETLTITTSFSDPAADKDAAYTCQVDFGDGSVIDGTVTGYMCTASNAYTTPGVYEIKVTIIDKDGDSVTKSNLDFNDSSFMIVYDAAAGFVTGGGWIDSHQGAYYLDPSLTGKASFGFVSKYKKGATIPAGNTEFQFKDSALNFHSSSYDWLVVSGSNYARFKGTGTINGIGEYKFMIWAGDGEPDSFRIKIWEENELGDETVIYDNGMDQQISGGNIVIHAGE